MKTAAAYPPSPGRSADVVLRALADPARRRILHLVRAEELAAGQIAAHFDASQQAVSHHLQVLVRAGLVAERRQGTRRLFSFEVGSLDPIRDELADFWSTALDQLKAVVEAGDEHPKGTR